MITRVATTEMATIRETRETGTEMAVARAIVGTALAIRDNSSGRGLIATEQKLGLSLDSYLIKGLCRRSQSSGRTRAVHKLKFSDVPAVQVQNPTKPASFNLRSEGGFWSVGVSVPLLLEPLLR
jgi:hypothetical protein